MESPESALCSLGRPVTETEWFGSWNPTRLPSHSARTFQDPEARGQGGFPAVTASRWRLQAPLGSSALKAACPLGGRTQAAASVPDATAVLSNAGASAPRRPRLSVRVMREALTSDHAPCLPQSLRCLQHEPQVPQLGRRPPAWPQLRGSRPPSFAHTLWSALFLPVGFPLISPQRFWSPQGSPGTVSPPGRQPGWPPRAARKPSSSHHSTGEAS